MWVLIVGDGAHDVPIGDPTGQNRAQLYAKYFFMSAVAIKNHREHLLKVPK